MISSKALQEFKTIWKEEFGEEPSDESAIKEAVQLLTMFDVIHRPIKKEWNNDYETHQRDIK